MVQSMSRNKASVFKNIGASNHTDRERERGMITILLTH